MQTNLSNGFKKSTALVAVLFVLGFSGCKQTAIPPEKEPKLSKKPLEPLREMEGEHDMVPPELPTSGEDAPPNSGNNGESEGNGVMPEAVGQWKFEGDLSGEALKETKVIYGEKCVGCHGETGAGDGPMASKLKDAPPDLGGDKTQRLSDGELLWTIQEGRLAQGKMMPGFKSLTEAQQKNLVGFVRTLKP